MGVAADVLVGVGKVYGGATGTTLPSTATSSLAGGFKDMGYVSDAGVVQGLGGTNTDIKAWGGDTIRTVETAHTLTYKIPFIETNADVLKAYYGNYSAGVVDIQAGQGIRQAWVIDMVDGSNVIRIAIPDGQVTANTDVTYKGDTAVTYEVTITCYPDVSGVKAYMHVLDAGAS